MRGFVRLAALVAFLVWVQAPAAHAKGKAAEPSEGFAVFVIGNTVFTLYHEFGHALIDKLEIPVLGREEDAVDSLAVLMMLPDGDDPDADALILAAADGYAMAHDQAEPDDLAFWDEHSLDIQRYAAVNCLIFGSDPDGFAELARIVEMPDEQQERCPGIYEQTYDSWVALLDPYFREEGQAGGGRIHLRFKRPGKGIDPGLVTLLKRSDVLREAVETVAETFVLPGDFDVVFESCDDSNAYYDTETGNVTVCSELVAYFAALFINDAAAR